MGSSRRRTRDEDLSQTNKDVGWRLDRNMNVIWQRSLAVHASGTATGLAVAWSSGINDMLYDGSVSKAQPSEEEADGYTRDGLEFDVHLAQERVDQLIQDWNEDDDGDGIEVLHQIIGHS